MTEFPQKDRNPLSGTRLTAWRAEYIVCIAGELFDHDHCVESSRELAKRYLSEAFGPLAREQLHDYEETMILSAIRRAARVLAALNRADVPAGSYLVKLKEPGHG